METYLQNQIGDIALLKQAVEEEAAQIERAAATVTTINGLNRAKKSFTGGSSPGGGSLLPSSRSRATKIEAITPPSNHAPDELEELVSMARRKERGTGLRSVAPISAEELEIPDVEWVAPTPEEAEVMRQTKPWLASMYPPTNFDVGSASTRDAAPLQSLQLEHVYGFRSNNVRNNVRFVDEHTIVYYSACIAVVQSIANTSGGSQRHFAKHTGEIVSMATYRNSDRCIVATGEMGAYPVVYVWDAHTCEVLAKLSGHHRIAVTALCFSQDGSRLATVGLDDDNTMVLYAWESGNVLGMAEGGPNRIIDLVANTTRTATPNAEFVSAGVGAVYFWRWSGVDGHLSFDVADLNATDGPKVTTPRSTSTTSSNMMTAASTTTFTCVRCTADYTLVGSVDGVLFQLRGSRLFDTLACHSATVTSIVPVGVDEVITGGSDGFLCRWSLPSKTRVAIIDANETEDPEATRRHANSIRALDGLSVPGAEGGEEEESVALIVGTVCGAISTCKLPPGTSVASSSKQLRCVVSAHFPHLGSERLDGEVTGLAASPIAPSSQGPLPNSDPACLVATCGEDATLRLYNYTTHTQIARHLLPFSGQCVTFHPEGSVVAVGLQNGTVSILEIVFNKRTAAASLREVASFRRTARRIQSIRFSPCGKLLAAGHADNGADIYSVTNCGTNVSFLKRVTDPISGVVMQLDFSKDSQFLQVCTQLYELYFFEIKATPDEELTATITVVDPEVVRDVEWNTYTSILGWSVQGIWNLGSDGSEVMAVACSPSQSSVAVADDNGSVKLFKYPCIGSGLDKKGFLHRRPQCTIGSGHSEHVSNVAWGAGGDVLFSLGGRDLSLLQWRVV